MATPTSSLRVSRQALDENVDTWGSVLNTGFDIFDSAIAGTADIATTGGTTTLSDADYTADEAKAAFLDVTGVLISNATIEPPVRDKWYGVRNGTSGAFTLTVKTATGTGVVIPQGTTALVRVDAGADAVTFLTPSSSTTGNIYLPSGGFIDFNSGAIEIQHYTQASGGALRFDTPSTDYQFFFESNDGGGYPVMGMRGGATEALAGYIALYDRPGINRTGGGLFSGGLYTFPRTSTGAVKLGSYIDTGVDNAVSATWGTQLRLGWSNNNVSNTLVMTGDTVTPAPASTVDLGTAASPFSDLYLKTNGQIDFGNGGVALRQSDTEEVALDFSGDATFFVGSYISGTGRRTYVELRNFTGTSNWADYFSTTHARGTSSAPTIVANGDSAIVGSVRAYDGATYRNTFQINVAVDGTPASANVPSRASFGINLGGTNVTNIVSLNKDNSWSPYTDDGAALGSTTYKWSDLHLASGAVVNWAAGNVKLTHSANALTVNTSQAATGAAFTASTYDTGSGAGHYASQAAVTARNSDGYGEGFALVYTRGTDSSPAAVQSGDYIGGVLWYAYDGTGYYQAANVSCTIDTTPGAADMPGRLVFSTTADGASSPTERWRITSTGVLQPGADATYDIGTSTVGINDLHFGANGIVNFDGGDVTILHSADTLTFNGGTYYIFQQSGAAPQLNSNRTDTHGSAVSVGDLNFYGRDSAAGTELYAAINAYASDATAASEDGILRMGVVTAGAFAYEAGLTGAALYPITNDGLALGTSSLSWSDLFLASGSVINFNASDVLLTHSPNALALTGGTFGIGKTPSAATLDIDTGGGTTSSIKTEHTGSNFIVRPKTASGSITIIENTGGGGLEIQPSGGGATLGGNRIQTVNDVSAIGFIIDGGGSAITTGVKGYLEIPFACTIQQVTMLADQTGSIVVDVWKDSYANYPPVDADSITASAVPTISSATKSQDATLTGWTTSISAGDILGFNVDSASTVTRVTISLKVKRT